MTDAEARRALLKAARAFATKMPDVAKGKGRAYEAWVMLALANLLVTKGFTVDAVDSAGNPVRRLRLRKKPAPMPSDANPGTSPGHLVIRRHIYCEYELHLGMQHQGESGALHEIDLTILPAEAGRWLRKSGGGPWRNYTCCAFELKAYDEGSSLDLGIGRALMGVAHDLNPGRIDVQVSVGRRARPLGDMSFGHDGPRLYLVTSAHLYPDTTTLLEWNNGATFASVIPKTNEGPLADIVEDMLEHCRCWW